MVRSYGVNHNTLLNTATIRSDISSNSDVKCDGIICNTMSAVDNISVDTILATATVSTSAALTVNDYISAGGYIKGAAGTFSGALSSFSNITGAQLSTPGMIAGGAAWLSGTVSGTAGAEFAGASRITDTLYVADEITTDAGVIVNGTMSGTGAVNMAAGTFSGALSSFSNITGAQLSTPGMIAGGAAWLSGNLRITGFMSSTGDVGCSDLVASGAVSSYSDLITNSAWISGNLGVNGTMSSTDAHTGAAGTFAGALSGSSTLNAAGTTVGAISTLGAMTANGAISGTGNVNMAAGTFSGAISGFSTLNAAGTTVGAISTLGAMTANGAISGTGAVNMAAGTFSGAVSSFSNISGAVGRFVGGGDGTEALYLGDANSSVLNVGENLYINIDSDSTGADHVLRIGKDRVGVTGGSLLFELQDDGDVSAGGTVTCGTHYADAACAGVAGKIGYTGQNYGDGSGLQPTLPAGVAHGGAGAINGAEAAASATWVLLTIGTLKYVVPAFCCSA